jgi:hypothetical protein
MDVYSRFISEIKSCSHILSESAFAILMCEEPIICVLNVEQDKLKIEVIMTEEMKKINKDYFGYAFMVSSSFLMALNIAALGHFTWLSGNSTFWSCEHKGPSGETEQVLVGSKNTSLYKEKIELKEGEVRKSVNICGSILHEDEQDFRKEYLKGILHLDVGYADLVFFREAFANFYRSFEYFITTKVLRMKKLKNEVRELQKGILKLGLSEDYCKEFLDLYKIRSEQVMHAQREPKEIDIDDVLKIKLFTDYALHKYYQSKADEWIEQWREKDQTG